jgi:hypothetical protein
MGNHAGDLRIKGIKGRIHMEGGTKTTEGSLHMYSTPALMCSETLYQKSKKE